MIPSNSWYSATRNREIFSHRRARPLASGPTAYWGAIVGAAALFGLAHLPATAALLPLTPLVVTRAVVLNGLAGVVFGWMYWRRGLEAAMVSHGAAT